MWLGAPSSMVVAHVEAQHGTTYIEQRICRCWASDLRNEGFSTVLPDFLLRLYDRKPTSNFQAVNGVIPANCKLRSIRLHQNVHQVRSQPYLWGTAHLKWHHAELKRVSGR